MTQKGATGRLGTEVVVIVEPSSDVRVSGSRGEEPDSDCSLTDADGDDDDHHDDSDWAIGSVACGG